MRRRPAVLILLALGCGPDVGGDAGPMSTGVTGIGGTAGSTVGETSDASSTGADDEADSTTMPEADGSTDATTTGTDDCLFCDGPNQACIDDVCVTTCQGQQPDPCGPDQICDVISGQCRDAAQPCTLAGPYAACGDASCGPGSVCDDQGACVAIAPCGDVACLDDGACWGIACQCERQSSCASSPDETALNGGFSVEIGDLEFADDCTAWMVTLRSGTDFVRRLELDGTLTEWPGVANLNMGEVKVLKALAPPPGIAPGAPDGLRSSLPSPSRAGEVFRRPAVAGVEGLGEVAITYTCCPTCGCFVDPPQGVARLIADDPANPLPIVIVATATQGTGPFGNTAADAGPHGLTWGVDRVLYVGNSTDNGDLNSADLDTGSQGLLTTFASRLTAGAPVSPVHNLFATEGGAIWRFNVETSEVTQVADVGSDVTALSHDAFSGLVYASLRNLDVVELDPFTGQTQPFATMPAIGRVAVSPDGQLWYTPLGFTVMGQAITAWDLPDSF